MATELKNYIKVYDEMFSSEFCKSVIESYNQSEKTFIDREQRPTFTAVSYTHLTLPTNSRV